MKRFSRILSLLILLGLAVPAHRALAQGAPEQALQNASNLLDAGDMKGAAEAFDQLLKDFPTSTVVSVAQYQLAFTRYVLGEHDKALEMIAKASVPPAPPEVIERALALKPKVIAAKAGALDVGDPKRKTAFENALKEYDAFLAKYPNSDEIEGIRYGKALALFQIESFEAAIATLRENIAAFPRSESIGDSRYLLGLSLARQFETAFAGDDAAKAAALPKADEAIAIFEDLAKGTNVSLANDARAQLGALYTAKGRALPEDQRQAFYDKAVSVLREVKTRDKMVKAQERLVQQIAGRIREAAQARNVSEIRRLTALRDREQEKVARIASLPERTIDALITIAEIYRFQERFDEARVVFRYVEPFADDTQKKTVLNGIALTYVAQNLPEQAAAAYAAFQAAYKGDPIGEFLAYGMGALFATTNPERAIAYLDEALKDYPKTTLAAEILTARANASIALGRFDEALKTLQDFLKTNPRKELAVQAESGIASIYSKTGKLDDAIRAFTEVRDKYPGTPQAEQAAFNVAGLNLQKGDNKTAAAEFAAFQTKFPQSALLPQASYYHGVALEMSGEKDAALAAYKQSWEKFPDAPNASDAYFRSALIYNGQQKIPEMTALLAEFVQKFPNSDRLYAAYDMQAQVDMAEGRYADAVARYTTMAEKHPGSPQSADALARAADLSKQFAESMGRYLAMNEEQRANWRKAVDASLASAKALLDRYPESAAVAGGLKTLLETEKLLVAATVKTEADVEKDLQELAEKFSDKPDTRAKILFTLAAYVYERDKEQGLAKMEEAFDPSLVFAPADLDLFGGALFAAGRLDKASEIYSKLQADYPIPAGVQPNRAPVTVQQAQSIALFGLASILQKQGDTAGAAAKFEELKATYPWSPKIVEADLGIALGKLEEKKFDEAQSLLVGVIRAPNASSDIRARAMLAVARAFEERGDTDNAIDNYIKVASFYGGVTDAAAEGLYKGSQLQRKKAAGVADPKLKQRLQENAEKAEKNLRENYGATEWGKKLGN